MQLWQHIVNGYTNSQFIKKSHQHCQCITLQTGMWHKQVIMLQTKLKTYKRMMLYGTL